MFASFKAEVPTVATMRIGGYGSRIALTSFACPGRRGSIQFQTARTTSRHKPALSPRDAPELCKEPSPHKAEGAGNAGRPLRPQSRVQCVGSTRGSHHGHTGITRHSLRNGFNGFLRALPGDRAFLSPSPADGLASLTPASGRQDHTTSPSASAPFVFGATRVHRTPPPTSVTIAKRPSVRDGMISLYSCFYQTGKRKIFADGTGHGIAKTARRANQLPPFTSPRLRGEVGLHAMQSG
jgi:hypothetical protein